MESIRSTHSNNSGKIPAIYLEILAIHPVHGEFYNGILGDFLLTIHGNTGFANVSKLCALENKQFKEWIKTANNKRYIETLKNDTTLKYGKIIYSLKEGSEYNSINGTYVCENVLYQVAQWISIEFRIKASNILSFFYKERQKITLKSKFQPNKEYYDEKEQQKEVEKILTSILEKVSKCKDKQLEELKNVKEENVQPEELKHVKEENKQLEEELKNVKEENAHLKEELKNVKDENVHYEEELKNVKEENVHFEEELGNVKEQMKHKDEELECKNKKMKCALEANTYLEEEKLNLEKTVTAMGKNYVQELDDPSKCHVFGIVAKGADDPSPIAAIRTQKRNYDTALKQKKKRFPDTETIYYLKNHPNSISFFNRIKQEFPNISTRYNDIYLPESYSIEEFIKDIDTEDRKPPRTRSESSSSEDEM